MEKINQGVRFLEVDQPAGQPAFRAVRGCPDIHEIFYQSLELFVGQHRRRHLQYPVDQGPDGVL